MSRLKHSVTIAGHRTSVTLEPAFFAALKDIAAEEGVSLNALIARIDEARAGQGLSSALRVFVLEHYRVAAGATAPPGAAGRASVEAVRRSR
jgi:predicted DNA-binding ribbon-helix-helix protein